jgi:hypothetical protein
MQLQWNSLKNQTWLITYVYMIYINYRIEDLFTTHLQL